MNLSRTKTAIEEYDKFDAQFTAKGTQEQVLKEFAKLEALREKVGRAFGLDTQDRNNIDNCAKLIHPGPKVPGVGFGESFVRRLVKKWEEEN